MNSRNVEEIGMTGNFMSLKWISLAKSLSLFLILAEWWSAECLTKQHLKHSLASIFWILIKPLFDGLILLVIWYDCYHLRADALKF